MILASPMPYTKALEFDVHDVVQNYGEKKKVANGITAMVSFNAIDATYIKGEDIQDIKDIVNSFLEDIPSYDVYSSRSEEQLMSKEVFWRLMLSKQYMEIKDHEGIIVIFTEEKGFEGQSVEGSQVIHFRLAEQAAITYLKRRLLDIHQFFVGTKTWIVLINDQLLHLGDNGIADNYNLDDLLSVKIFKSDDDNHSTLGMMFLVGEGRVKQIKKCFIRTHSDILISIETATKMFCMVPLERQMCDKTASPFDGRIWLLDQQQYQLIVNYFPPVMDTRAGIQDITFLEFSNKSVPGFKRKLFGKRCQVADDEGSTMVLRTAVLRHFAIAPVYACRFHSPKCMTLFAAALNGNLRELLDEGLLNWQERVRVLYHVASAIAFLHRRRILHLDVTCTNIVVDENLNARLTDFGSAKVLAAGEKQIKCADEQFARLGRTEGYMPAKVNLHLDKTVDYFNFGVVIRECLTGELPTRPCNCNSLCFLRQETLCWDFNKQKSVWQYNGGLNENARSICDQLFKEHDITDELGKVFKELQKDERIDGGFDIVRRCAKTLANCFKVDKNRAFTFANDCVRRVFKLIDISHTNSNIPSINSNIPSIYEEILELSSKCLNSPSVENSEAGQHRNNLDLDFENEIKKPLWNILYDCACQPWERSTGQRKTDTKSDQALCEVCLLNQAHKGLDQIVHDKPCQNPINLCLSCIKSHYINPIECHSCTIGLPRIGGDDAMLLCLRGYGKCEHVFENNVQDIENICKSLLHPTLCIRKSTMVPQPRTMSDIENQIDDGINTLVFYFAGHGDQIESVAHMVASETLNITARDLENLARKKSLKTFIIIRDCCYPQKINEIPGCNLMQLSACYDTEISSAGTGKERNGPFTKYLKAALIGPDEKCVPDCDFCKTYYDHVNNAGVVRMEDIHKFIKAHYDKANIKVDRCKPTPVMHLADHNTQTVSFSNSSRINLRIDGISNRTIHLSFHTEWERFWNDAVDAYINEYDEHTARGGSNSQDDTETARQNLHLVNLVDNSKVTDLQKLRNALQEKAPIRIARDNERQSEVRMTEDDTAEGQEEVDHNLEVTDHDYSQETGLNLDPLLQNSV